MNREKNESLVDLQFSGKANPDLNLYNNVSFDPQTFSDFKFAVGATYDLDENTKFKAKIDTFGKLTTAWNHKINGSSSLGLGASFDIKNLGSSVFGVHLKFN